MLNKRGGLLFFRVGRFGGSFYIARKMRPVSSTRGKALLRRPIAFAFGFLFQGLML